MNPSPKVTTGLKDHCDGSTDQGYLLRDEGPGFEIVPCEVFVEWLSSDLVVILLEQ
jgi:hypothetical protein